MEDWQPAETTSSPRAEDPGLQQELLTQEQRADNKRKREAALARREAERGLSEEQSAVLERFFSQQCSFLTGGAGRGTSRALQAATKRARQQLVGATALTGLAALPLGEEAMTLHAWAGLGRADAADIGAAVARARAESGSRWMLAQLLVIDDVSMLEGGLLDLLEKVAREIRQPEEPFGGLRVVLCGGFAQLPPVGAEGGTARFCFESAAWRLGGFSEKTLCLKTVHRQKGDALFTMMLNELRLGKLTWSTRAVLLDCASKPLRAESANRLGLHSKCADVGRINADRLATLPGEGRGYDTDDGKVVLKEGARVMLTANLGGGIMDGSCGAVQSTSDCVTVLFDGAGLIAVWPRPSRVPAGGQRLPLRLAWAITIHKSQGISADDLDVCLDGVFASGQAYVALSRVRSLSGLRILGGVCAKAVWLDPKVEAILEEQAAAVVPGAATPFPSPVAAHTATAPQTTLELLRVEFGRATHELREAQAERQHAGKHKSNVCKELPLLRRDVETYRKSKLDEDAAAAERKVEECQKGLDKATRDFDEATTRQGLAKERVDNLATQIAALERVKSKGHLKPCSTLRSLCKRLPKAIAAELANRDGLEQRSMGVARASVAESLGLTAHQLTDLFKTMVEMELAGDDGASEPGQE
jgi:hypothetical protein